MLLIGSVLLFSGKAHAQWVVTDPGNFAGNIVNSVNFPTVEVPRTTERRICVLHKNVPNMLSQISGVVSAAGINIETMVNKSKKDNAYTVLDVEGDPDEAALEKILAIDGVIRVRKI